jgi:phage gp29-like protein
VLSYWSIEIIIVALVKSAKSLEEIQAGLENMYPDMNQVAFADLIGEAYKAAYLAGMDDVVRGK